MATTADREAGPVIAAVVGGEELPSWVKEPQRAARAPRRRIGPLGTAIRALVGLGLLVSVILGHAAGPFRPGSWALGLVGFPAVVLAWQRIRVRRAASRLAATGPVGHVLNLAVFLALYLTPSYAPALAFTSDAALIFYGASMLLAAVRGYGGCEALAISNWLLRRDDQVGCLLFLPVDLLERRHDASSGQRCKRQY
jgi:hypothetical protein